MVGVRRANRSTVTADHARVNHGRGRRVDHGRGRRLAQVSRHPSNRPDASRTLTSLGVREFFLSYNPVRSGSRSCGWQTVYKYTRRIRDPSHTGVPVQEAPDDLPIPIPSRPFTFYKPFDRLLRFEQFIARTSKRADFDLLRLEDPDELEHYLRVYFMMPRNIAPLLRPFTVKKVEEYAFCAWRDRFLHLQEDFEFHLPPYENNPFQWQQFWRLLETSDILLYVEDARQPLSPPPEVLRMVQKHKMPVLHVLNKADVLTEDERAELVRQGSKLLYSSMLHRQSRASLLSEKKEGFLSGLVSAQELKQRLIDMALLIGMEKESREERAEKLYCHLVHLAEALPERHLRVKQMERCAASVCLSGILRAEANKDKAGATAIGWEAGSSDSGLDSTGSTTRCTPHHVPPLTGIDCQSTSGSLKQRLSAEAFISRLFGSKRSLLEAIKRVNVGLYGMPNVGKAALIRSLLSCHPQASKRVQKRNVLQPFRLNGSPIVLWRCPGLMFPIAVKDDDKLVFHKVLRLDYYRGDLMEAAEKILKNSPESPFDIFGKAAIVAHKKVDEDRLSVSRDRQIIANLAAAMKYTNGGKGGEYDLDRVCRIIISNFKERGANAETGLRDQNLLETVHHLRDASGRA